MIGSILRGTVLTCADPMNLERVKITVPQATGPGAVWASALQRGSAAAPAPGSAVWVLYESCDVSLPVYIPVAAWSPWTPLPSAWVAAGWNPYTGAYRVGPAGQVQYQGELSTPDAATSTTIANASTVLSLPAALWPGRFPASCPVVVMPGGAVNSVCAVARVGQGPVDLYSGPWTYTGTTYLSLSGLRYATGY